MIKKARCYEGQTEGQNMDWKPEEEDCIRRYLLDEATQDERRQVEARLLEEDDYGELALLIEDELIDDYARGALPARERKLFERNFLLTPQRRQDLMIAREITKYAAAQPVDGAANQARGSETRQPQRGQEIGWRQRRFNLLSPAWRAAVFALLILGLGLGGWWWWRGEPEVEPAMAALNRAYAAQRPLKARITGFDHAPFPEARGPEQKEETDYVALDRAERILLDAMAQRPNPLTQHALGRLYLAKKDFHQARKLFDAALQSDPDNAQLHSDLGAALFEQWNQSRSASQPAGSEELRSQSLEHLTRALELNSSLHEARFNRALLYQASGSAPLAREEWQRYLAADPNSRWTADAKKELDNLQKAR